MDVSQLFLHLTPTGLQKVARRNCASSLVEQAVEHAAGQAARLDAPSTVTAGLLRQSVMPHGSSQIRD
jgi:hypothetical protein